MKYRIELAGRGGEIAIGTVKREVYDYFQEKSIDVEEYAGDWDNEQGVPEEFQPFEPGSWHECDDLCHSTGPALDYCYITVTDENGNVIHDNISAGDMMELGMDYNSQEIYPEDMLNDGDVYFIGQSIEKGLFQAYEFEAESFDPTKLFLQGEYCDGWELITGASYDDVSLDELGELSTTGKGAEYQMILVKKINV
jgi:hypothetical protein